MVWISWITIVVTFCLLHCDKQYSHYKQYSQYNTISSYSTIVLWRHCISNRPSIFRWGFAKDVLSIIQFLIAAKLVFADSFLLSTLLANLLRKSMQNLINYRAKQKEKNRKEYLAQQWLSQPFLNYGKTWFLGNTAHRISSANVTKSAGNCGFGHIYWRNPQWKTSFFVCSVKV